MAINQRFLTIANGHMILTGNTLMIYQQDVANGGPFITTNTNLQVPGYPAGTTLNWQENSSMAVLTIPPGATVLHAELTWSSLLISGAVDYSAFANDPVNFITPAGVLPIPIAPQFVDTTVDIATRSADVTALVQAGGSGQYTLGRIAGVNGIESTGTTGNAAGWYLSVVVENPSETSKLFQINVGNVFVPGNSTIDFTISGFATPATGPVTGRLFAGIQRGDPVGDTISIFTGPDVGSLNYQLSRPPMPDNNMIAGFISNTETGAVIDTSGTFGNNNNIPGNPPVAQPFARWHIDIAAFDISPSLGNNQTTFVTRSVSEAQVAVFDYNVYNVQIEAQAASLTAIKTANLAFAQTGDTITYTIETTNNGDIQADNVVITDAIPAGTTFVPGSLVGATGTPPTLTLNAPVPAGGSATVSFQVLVGDTLPVPNPLVNNATVDYTFEPLPGEPPMSGSTITNDVETQINAAIIDIVKTADQNFVGAGDIITYTLQLSNTGNTAANSITLTDAVPSGTTFVPGSVTGATGAPPTLTLAAPLAPGGSATVTFQVQVDNALPSPNPILNTATADFTFTVDPAQPDGATGTQDSNTVTTQANIALLSTTKAVDATFAEIGQVLTYTLTIANTGNVAATNVVITDPVPSGTTFVPGSVTGAAGIPPTLTIASIAAGGTATVTFQVQVGDTFPVPNPIPNAADVDFTYTVDPANPDGASGTAPSNTVTTQVNDANIAAVKTVDKTISDVGEVLTYTLVLQNTGNVTATNVVITDPVPAGTTFINGSLIGATGTPPTLNVPAIPAGGSATISYQVLIGDVIPAPNPIPNTADVDFTFTLDPANPDGQSGESTSNTVNTQVNSAIIETTKTADTAFADVGDTITYTITVTNSGNAVANNVVLTDALPAGVSFVAGSLVGATGTPPTLTLNAPVPAGGSAVVSYQVLVGASVPNSNPIENSTSAAFTYTVDPTQPNGASGVSFSNTVETEINTAKLEMVKSVNKFVAYLNDTITYQIALTNTGNAPANNVVITDPIPVGTVLVPGSMTVSVPFTTLLGGAIQLTNPVQPGETVAISFAVLVTAIPNPNPIVNVANAAFTYTVDPQNPDGVSGTSQTNAVTTTVFRNNFGQQISDLIESVALEQAALAAIANAEGAKIQRMAAMPGVTPQQLLCLNKSVSDMTDSLAMLEAVLKQKLSIVNCQIDGSSC